MCVCERERERERERETEREREREREGHAVKAKMAAIKTMSRAHIMPVNCGFV